MSDMSNYLETSSYDYWFRPGAAAPTRPTSHKVSLWSAVTDDEAGTGTELEAVNSPGYARFTATFGASVDGSGTNDALAITPTATGNWLTATHFGVHDHLGNLLSKLRPLDAPLTVTVGNHGELAIGALRVTYS